MVDQVHISKANRGLERCLMGTSIAASCRTTWPRAARTPERAYSSMGHGITYFMNVMPWMTRTLTQPDSLAVLDGLFCGESMGQNLHR